MNTLSTTSVSSNNNVTIDDCQSETSSTTASITSTKSNLSTISTNKKSSNSKRIIDWSTVGDEFVRTVRIHMGYGLSKPAQRAVELYTVHY